MKKRYWVDVCVGFDFYKEGIEAESEEEAKDIAYEMGKKAMNIHDPILRPRTVRVMGVGEIKEEN